MIKPFTIAVPEERLSNIQEGLDRYDWTQLPDISGWNGGVGIRGLKRLVKYWRHSYEWREVEKQLNHMPNFVADVEQERIHFLHWRGNGSKPPILLLHGWPGSYLEFESIWQALTEDGHDVIVPSLPGFAFSTPITSVIGPRRAAVLMHALMLQLFGETRYLVQGGDWGANIASWMAFLRPDFLLGFHVNMAHVFAEDVVPSTPEEHKFLIRRNEILDWETGYNHEQETKPQRLGVALADSPVGAAGWILEKFGRWADLPKTSDGSPDLWSRFTEERLITNIMLYLAPSAMVTATWIYHGKRLEGSSRFPAGTRVTVPLGIAAFPDPVFIPTPRSYAEKTYNVLRWTAMPHGGHFAAWEQPELLLQDLRDFIALVAK